MKKNDIYEIDITGITDEGHGVGRADGIVVFVPYALKGEKVRIIIIKVLRSYSVGKILDIIAPSQKRIKAECEYFYRCGGCSYQNALYSEELEYKYGYISDCIKKIAKSNAELLPIKGAEAVKCYRNKSQFPVSKDGIGIYAPKSHRVVDMDKCIIQADETEKIVAAVRKWMSEYNILPYDEKSDTGCVRHIYIRSGNSETMVVIVTRTKKIKFSDKLVDMLTRSSSRICSVMQNVNLKRTNVVLGEETKLLWGRAYIIDNIGEKRFKISSDSFYQVNNAQTSVLYDVAKEFADVKNGDIVWDLYCGIGTIGQCAAEKAKKIIGIEIVEAAVKDAKENAELNKMNNCEYYCGLAEQTAYKLIENGDKPNVVFLDPPRKGCDVKLLETVVESQTDKIVYISCKPSTLARDLLYLTNNGYRIEKIQPVDLFPRTPHVETVALLSRTDALN